MSKAAPDVPSKIKGRVLLLLVGLLAFYAILPRLGGDFSEGWATLHKADPAFVGAGIVAVVLTYVLASVMYWLLAIKRIKLVTTLGVEAATAFTNRLLPAGLGGLSLNVAYLRASKHTLPQALAVAGANNTLGLVGHVLLLAFVGITSAGTAFGDMTFSEFSTNSLWIVVALAILVGGVLLAFRKLRHYLYVLSIKTLKDLIGFRKHPFVLIAALFCSMSLTLCYVAILYVSGRAVGIDLPVWNVFVAFTVGIFAASVTPTPGGLGGAEAGLLAGLVSFGADFSTAFAAVLLYRLLTYWIPLLPGLAVFLAIRKRYL